MIKIVFFGLTGHFFASDWRSNHSPSKINICISCFLVYFLRRSFSDLLDQFYEFMVAEQLLAGKAGQVGEGFGLPVTFLTFIGQRYFLFII